MQYALVLGAIVDANGPKPTLLYRLDTAVSFLLAHPQVQCIVSGGRCKNEPCAEAEAMQAYMLAHGIPKERIITEAQSLTTFDNFLMSRRYMDVANDTVYIITSGFHIPRAKILAKAFGYKHTVAVAAPSNKKYLVRHCSREIAVMAKDAVKLLIRLIKHGRI